MILRPYIVFWNKKINDIVLGKHLPLRSDDNIEVSIVIYPVPNIIQF